MTYAPRDNITTLTYNYSRTMNVDNWWTDGVATTSNVTSSGALSLFPSGMASVSAFMYLPKWLYNWYYTTESNLSFEKELIGFPNDAALRAYVHDKRVARSGLPSDAPCTVDRPCIQSSVSFTNTVPCNPPHSGEDCRDLPRTGPIEYTMMADRNSIGNTRRILHPQRTQPYKETNWFIQYYQDKCTASSIFALTGVKWWQPNANATRGIRIATQHFSYPPSSTDTFAIAIAGVFPLIMVLR